MAKRPKYGGRKAGVPNKATREIKAIALAMVPEANKTLKELLKGASDAVKARCIEIVYERAYGKAPQAIQHSGQIGTYDLSKLEDGDLDSLATILRSASVTGGGSGGEGEAGD